MIYSTIRTGYRRASQWSSPIFHSRHLLRPQQDVRRHAGAPQVYGAWAVRGQPARLFARGTICTDYARLGPFLTSFARRQMYLTGCIPCAHGWGGDEQANGGAAVGRWCRKKKRRVEGGEGVHVRW